MSREDHPSYGDGTDPDSYFPEGVTAQDAKALVDRVIAKIETLGLYLDHAHLALGEVDDYDDDESEEQILLIHAVFTFGKIAFTPRVQDPEQDEFDNSFRAIELTEAEAAAQAIIDRFRRDDDS